MNTELFIARRLFFSKEQSQRMSRRVVRLAVIGISLGMMVMLLSVSIVIGFQQEIKQKVNGFAAHLQIVNYDSNQSFQTEPVDRNPGLLDSLSARKEIRHVEEFATKPGMIKTKDAIQGVVLKGVGRDFDWHFFDQYKISGAHLKVDSTLTNGVWISSQLSSLLKLHLGDSFRMYFLNENEKVPRIRRFTVHGIYRTGLDDFDKMFVLADIRHIQRLNSWKGNQISGYEIFLKQPEQAREVQYQLRTLVISLVKNTSQMMRVVNIRDKFPGIFDWLDVLDMNVWVILILMTLVAGFNMVSGLLVIMLERTQMIGILKSMGAANFNVRKIFMWLAAFLIGEGLLWGNVLGLLIMFIQYQFKLIHLDPASYYVDTVPIHFSVINILWLNLGALFITLIMLIGPSFFVSRLSPDKTIRFD